MIDENEEDEITEPNLLSQEIISEYSNIPLIINIIRKKFKRLTKPNAIKLINYILCANTKIHVNDISKAKAFLQYNKSKFESDTKILKLDVLKSLNLELKGKLLEIGKELSVFETEKNRDSDCYKLDKNTIYSKIRKLICDEGGEIDLKYDFDTPDMELDFVKNTEGLQRCNIQITSSGIKFDYPVEYKYMCSRCNFRESKKAYETVSSRCTVQCEGVYNYFSPTNGEPKAKICGLKLYPDDEISLTKDCYYYEMGYIDEKGVKQSVGAISFKRIEPGFYESVLFKVKNPKKMGLYHIVDTKDMITNNFVIPDKVDNENYLFTLQRAFDYYIKKQTGMNLYGLTVIKCALILQKVFEVVMNKLVANIQIVGDASTGKSAILKYFSFLINSNFNLSTNAVSISVPSLRGTRETINLMGRDIKIITLGYLGTYNTIHIDEIAENKELQQNLKVFLMEENYSYNKAGANENTNKRTSQINISENLDFNHVGQYIGSIRKAYKDDTLKINDVDKPNWDENEDFYKPLHKYIDDNPYLYKVIKDKRDELMNKKVWWIDGLDYALHQRFPFYFYLTNKKENVELNDAVKENASTDPIGENLELIKVLRSDNIKEFFESLKNYSHCKDDILSFIEVDKILEQYGIRADARTRMFYYSLLRSIRIINQRFTIEKEDYDILKWFKEKTNCKVDVADIVKFEIEGPPNLKEKQKKAEQIEDATSKTEEFFDDNTTDFDNPYS